MASAVYGEREGEVRAREASPWHGEARCRGYWGRRRPEWALVEEVLGSADGGDGKLDSVDGTAIQWLGVSRELRWITVHVFTRRIWDGDSPKRRTRRGGVDGRKQGISRFPCCSPGKKENAGSGRVQWSAGKAVGSCAAAVLAIELSPL